MNFVSSAANACPWISIKFGGLLSEEVKHRWARCCPFCEAFGLFSRSSCLAVPLVILLGFASLRGFSFKLVYKFPLLYFICEPGL